MRCSCCGRKKRFSEVFESVSDNINLCVDCGQLIYRMKDAEKEGKDTLKKEFIQDVKERMSKHGSEEFKNWFNSIV